MDLKCYHYPLELPAWQKLINGSGKKDQARIVVVEVHRQPAGFAMWANDLDDTTTLHRVGVLPKFRRHGLGLVLVAACVRHSFENHIPVVRVIAPHIHCCPGHEDDVSAFLAACDFKPSGEIINNFKVMYGEYVDGYVFKRGTHYAVTAKR